MLAGSRVVWRHAKDDGSGPAVELAGVIASVERGGQPATWSALVLEDSGAMSARDVKDLLVVPDAENGLSPRPDQAERDEIQACRDARTGEHALAQYLLEVGVVFEGDVTSAVLDLLRQFQAEVLALGEERDGLKLAVERLKKAAKKGGKKDVENAAETLAQDLDRE
jgi:hypothetical protein